ncbi:hypothetical protein SKAU_G00070100 [Synaphobranchus kaupii]|uniref:DDE Tnp4 domain-containing protein n=1 Tax=Synaphobranchus kaupii TaxID=118154 RepID=A0A9Q1G861_SYNKA|nr:hypothetical protein SKAU_G00070100 [Synaphobranchus kaupii]
MTAEQMDQILALVGPDLTKMTTNYRAAIEPKQRLAVTLRFLATGETFSSLAFSYRLGRTTVATLVHMTCRAIIRRMMARQFPRPTQNSWREIASSFWEKWNFPNCLGAIDGKHVTIQAPDCSGSLFYNYKKTFSIVLLALVDANYKFINVQVGDFGRSSDGGIFANSDLGRGMANNSLHVPADTLLPGSGVQGPMPHTMVGDAAFPLKTYLMRPYPGHHLPRARRLFNYRLSRARMVVECAFGILAARWRVFHTTINMKPCNVDNVILAACILHNFLVSPADNQRWLDEEGERGNRLQSVRNVGGHRGPGDSYEVREKHFFHVPWQDKMV